MTQTSDPGTPTADDVLEALPYAVLALGIDGVILRANGSARELVAGVAAPAARTCRDLFACRGVGGPCQNGCLVTRAARSSGPAAEVRVDTAGGSSPGALWVTVAPLAEGHGAIMHLRPGLRGDRRRSTERWATDPGLRIRVLGHTRVKAREDTLDTDWVSQRPGQILKYLVCERARVVTVDEISEAIWPDGGPGAASNTRYAIHRLRSKLEPRRAAHDPPTFVVAREGGYTLDRDQTWIDADEFQREVDHGRAAMARFAPDVSTEHLQRAVELYGGPFLADEPYADWAADERNHLAGLATYALRVLIALARERDDGPQALRHLMRLSELDPLDSSVHRELVQGLIGEGKRSEAKRRYDSFAHRLWHALGQRPEFDLRSLAEQQPDHGPQGRDAGASPRPSAARSTP